MRVAASFDLRVARFECQTAETIADTRPRSGAAIARPELMSSSWPSRERGRREGRVPTAPMVRVQQKARGRTTGTGGSSGLPCAMVLRFIRALPGDHAWLPPSPARRLKRLHELSACIGAPGPHDFAVRDAFRKSRSTSLVPAAPQLLQRRISAVRLTRLRADTVASTASHPNVRDDRDTPLVKRMRRGNL
jgi:hypothetical protein